MTDTNASAEIARLLWESGAITVSRDRPFILAAGWASPVYVDCRRLIGDPAVRREVTAIAAAAVGPLVHKTGVEAIVGAETAGISFAAWLADSLDLQLSYIRKHPLGIGRNAQVEGASVEQKRVLLVDDLTSDGTSKLAFARGLRAAGAVVEHALTIFYHDMFPGAAERLRSEGLTLLALANWTDLLHAQSSARLSSDDRAEIETFRADPLDWSVRHGGRGTLQPAVTNITHMSKRLTFVEAAENRAFKGFFLELRMRDAAGAIEYRRLVGQSGSLDEARERAVVEIDRSSERDKIVGFRIVNRDGDTLHASVAGREDE